MSLLYIVRCEISHAEVAKTWLKWLTNEHIADVLTAGAQSARIVHCTPPKRLDAASDGQGQRSPVVAPSSSGDAQGAMHTYEIHYVFDSPAAFEAYEKNHAPRLRQEGLEHFPLEKGLHYSRRIETVLYETSS